MIEKKRSLLVPQYMRNFKCIGTKCEDSCCVGWRVDIDEVTYKKYQKVRDDELTPALDKFVTRNRTADHNSANHAKVKLLNNGVCPFLNNEMLCRIQTALGEEFLSDVCATYPRDVNIVNGVFERSATVSCPEIARLALLSPDGIEFDEIEEPVSIRNIIKVKLDTKDKRISSKPLKYFWELRFFIISLLQNRGYTLSERLIILGLFFQKLQNCIDDGKNSEILDLIQTYTRMIDEKLFTDVLSTIPVNNNVQMELLKEITDKRYFEGINSNRYLECFTEFLHGIQYTEDAKVEEVGQRYQDAFNKYYMPFLIDNEYIFENYLVSYVFKNLFPFTGEKMLFDSYMMLVLHHALIKMNLIGMSAYHKGLNQELTIKLIQSFAKTIEHNRKYLYNISQLMIKNNFNNLAYMTILIMN